jgi:hypothetical protein
MNIAKDVRDAWTVEAHLASASCFVESEVKSLSFEEGKHIVEEGITVGKLHRRSDWNYQHMRIKALVVLHKTKVMAGPSS